MSRSRQEQPRKLTYGSNNGRNLAKLRELILYISRKCENDGNYGAVKLAKILFYSDFVSYAEYGEPITGVEYQKYPKGPLPGALKKVREDMRTKGDIAVSKRLVAGYTQHRVIAQREPDYDKLRPRDIALVDSIIELLAGHNADAVSRMSHDKVWHNTDLYDHIPYEAAFVSDEPLTEEDIAIGEDMIREYERSIQSDD